MTLIFQCNAHVSLFRSFNGLFKVRHFPSLLLPSTVFRKSNSMFNKHIPNSLADTDSLWSLQDVTIRSWCLTTKPVVVTTSGKRLLKTSVKRRLFVNVLVTFIGRWKNNFCYCTIWNIQKIWMFLFTCFFISNSIAKWWSSKMAKELATPRAQIVPTLKQLRLKLTS